MINFESTKLSNAMGKVDYFLKSDNIKIDYETFDKISINVTSKDRCHNVFIYKNGKFNCTCTQGSIYPVLCSHVQSAILFLWITRGKDWMKV